MNEEYKDKYCCDLDRIQQDFHQQSKEYLEDHLLHQRTVFMNQKASFDKEFQQMRDAMDLYLAKMYAIKATLEDDIDSLQQKIATTRTTMPAHACYKEPEFSVQQHESQLKSSMFQKMSHPYPPDTFITVKNPYIFIAKVQVHCS